MQILSRMRVSLYGHMRVSLCGQMRTYARLWDIGRARLCQRVWEKFRIDFSQSLMNLMLCRSAEAGF
jgi:hypothetical protein